MSLTFGAVSYFHNKPEPSLRRSRSLNEISERLPTPRPRPRRTSALSEADKLLDRDLDPLENHVPSSIPSINEDLVTSTLPRKPRFSKFPDRSRERPKIKRNFSLWNLYEYTPLPPNCIRLLCFKPSPLYAPIRVAFELVEVSLDDAPSYEALSYRWSSGADHKVTCDGGVLFISGNCQRALKRLNTENRRLWVDAICINQQDIDERNSQVALMSQIYSKAERTVAWLGEDKDLGASCLADINGAVPYLRFFIEDWATKDSQSSFGMNKNSIITLLRDDALAPSLAMSKLLRRPWFSRMWIQQEVALAKDIWIYCGSQSTTWSAFSSVLKVLKMKSKLSKDFRAASNLATFRHQYQKNRDSGGVDIHTAMVQARQCDATDMRDKVYALLGVCPGLARFVGEPDYKLDVWVIWARAQRAYLASLSINALSLVSVGGGVRDDLPSWVPDLSTGARTWPRRPPSPTPTDGKAKILQCSGNSDSCLHIWGAFIDTVAHNYGQTENNSVEEMLAQCRNWWIHFLQMQVNSGTIISDCIVAFWSTLYCDVNNSIPRTIDDARLQEWHSRIIRLDSTDGGEGAESIQNAEEDALPGIRVLDFLESTSNKVFGATEECTIGLFPSEAQIGDRVVLFAGGTIPYLLRPTSRSFNNTCFRRSAAVYQLIGPCYVYGLGDAAARAKHLSNAQEISLS